MNRHAVCLVMTVICCLRVSPVAAHDDGKSISESDPPGIGGDGPFPASGIRLLSHLSLTDLGSEGLFYVLGNDVWGWTDPQTKREYALFGRTNGTSIVDITDPREPAYLGDLHSATGNSVWRDIKVYQNHAYVVADDNGRHGLQIFDLTTLRDLTPGGPPQEFVQTAHYSSFQNAHNIAINEQTGYAYVVGANVAFGGLHILDLSNPTSPTVAGEFRNDGYTHDVQVVVYGGPDSSYAGRELAFAANADTLTIVDVTNKNNPALVSRNNYPDRGYAHQGWLSEDHRFFFMNDELDEEHLPWVTNTRTHIWDVSDLDHPDYVGHSDGVEISIDHNHYIDDGLIFQANYTSGLRVLEMVNPAAAELREIAFLDTYPTASGTSFNGAWSTYPFFESGTIVVSDRQNGLFIARLGTGDFDGDGDRDLADIDLLTSLGDLTQGVVAPGWEYDLYRDQTIDELDLEDWLEDAGRANGLADGYLRGDANLDGTVDATDFNIWNSHKFLSGAVWSDGDFNGDGFVDTSDFNLWNGNKFLLVPAAGTVPEPTAACLLLFGMGFLTRAVRVRNARRSAASRPGVTA